MNNIRIIAAFGAAILAASCAQPTQSGSAYLAGHFNSGSVKEVSVNVHRAGVLRESQRVKPEDGGFVIEVKDVTGFIDVSVDLGETSFGAHLEPADTLFVDLDEASDGKFDYAFRGRTADACGLCTDITNTYYAYWNYYPGFSEGVTEDNVLSILESRDSAFRASHQLDEYYSGLVDMLYKQVRLFVLRNQVPEGEDASANPEIAGILAEVDLNDPAYVNCGLTALALNMRAAAGNPGLSDAEHVGGMLTIAEAEVTDTTVRKALSHIIGDNMFIYGSCSREEYETLWPRLQAFAAGCPQEIERYASSYESIMSLVKGADVADVTFTAPDGSPVQLSSLFGKVLYIDCWATWCGPCCAEIPYLEKLARRFKGNGNVAVISVSVDRDEAAWHKKIEADKPAWPQYIVLGDNQKQFSSDWNILTIPRFIIIDRDGKVYDPDAPRPSSEGIYEYIKAAI